MKDSRGKKYRVSFFLERKRHRKKADRKNLLLSSEKRFLAGYVDTGDAEKDRENCVWERVGEYENPIKSLGISETAIMIAGHTITSYYRSPEPSEHCKIFKNFDSQKIMIDCGAKVLYNNKVYTLAMMRLDDLEEFYF